MKYLLLIVVLIGAVCVLDAMVPNDSQPEQQAVAPQYVSNSSTNLKASCQEAPLFVENTTEQPTVARSIWFPGRNLLEWHRRNVQRRQEHAQVVIGN